MAPHHKDVVPEKIIVDETNDFEAAPAGNGEIPDATEYTEEQYRKSLRKTDWVLLPLMWFCYGIQQSDKVSVGTQAIFGLREDTHLVGQQYSWLTTIFYITYLIGEFPSNFFLQKWSLGRGLSVYMFFWGVCVMCIGAAQNFPQLMALRALQGFFECTISPGFMLIIGTWYRTDEHTSRSLFFQSADAGWGIIGSLAMYGIGSHAEKHGGLAPWRAISLFLGSATIAMSLLCFAFLGSPKEVRWLTAEERKIAQARIVDNKSGRDVHGTKWSWPQVGEAFRDPQLYFCTLNAFFCCVPNGGLTTFSSIILQSFGFTNLQVLLIRIPYLASAMAIFALVGYYTRRVPNRRMYIMAAVCVPALIGFLGMALLPNTPALKWTKWGMWMLTNIFSIALFFGWSMIPSNVAGRTKKSVISSATFIGYCVGNMTGSQIFRSGDAPRYVGGTVGSCVCLAAEILLVLLWRAYYRGQNRSRDRAAAARGIGGEERERRGQELGEADVTDLQNPHFRYTM